MRGRPGAGGHRAVVGLLLSPGTYRINTYSGSVTVTVDAGVTTRGVDLPDPGCL